MHKFIAPTAMASIAACSLAGCNQETALAPESKPALQPPETPAAAELLGTWTGPEGMYVIIRSQNGNAVELEMQSDLDTRGTYAGTITEAGIAFDRNGSALLLRPALGDETGLKYLVGKADCLMVGPGEGYCRTEPSQ